MAITASVEISPKPDYGSLGLSQVLPQGFSFQPAGVSFSRGADGRNYAVVFPTLFYEEPLVPGLEFVETSAGVFQLHRVLTNVAMGSARGWAPVQLGNSGDAALVIVDHGLETRSGYETWPFGHVWLARDSGSGFTYTQLSTVAAFNHSVSVGDISGDGVEDIVISHMGVKNGGVRIPVHAYVQASDGTFAQDVELLATLQHTWGLGAVGVADLDGDGAAEVVLGSYLESSEGFGALRIMSRDSGTFATALDIAREGLHITMGVTQIIPFDYDQDGDLDLLLFLEGRHPEHTQGRYTGNGLEVYRNDGSLDFQRVTQTLFAQNVWAFSDMQARELAVADFDFDGYPDIVLNGWMMPEPQDAGGLLFRNASGASFQSLSGTASTAVEFSRWEDTPQYWRLMDSADGTTRLFGFTTAGAPITLNLRVGGRDGGEHLTVGGRATSVMGFGGDDTFTLSGQAARIDGGAGMDRVFLPGERAGYAVEVQAGVCSVRPVVSADAGHSFTQVERLHFSDGKLAFDLEGHAGVVAKLLGAVFGATAVHDATYAGIGLSLLDGGTSVPALAELALQARLGDTADRAVVELLYGNVIGGAPSAGDLAYFQGMLASGAVSRADLVLLAAETGANLANIGFVGLASSGLAYV
ncbi:MAG TPA: FG-GAP-like repeat-containing protein [Ramlibacter sp.]